MDTVECIIPYIFSIVAKTSKENCDFLIINGISRLYFKHNTSTKFKYKISMFQYSDLLGFLMRYITYPYCLVYFFCHEWLVHPQIDLTFMLPWLRATSTTAAASANKSTTASTATTTCAAAATTITTHAAAATTITTDDTKITLIMIMIIMLIIMIIIVFERVYYYNT